MLLRRPYGFMDQGCSVGVFGVRFLGLQACPLSGEEKSDFHSSHIVVRLAILVIMHTRDFYTMRNKLITFNSSCHVIVDA